MTREWARILLFLVFTVSGYAIAPELPAELQNASPEEKQAWLSKEIERGWKESMEGVVFTEDAQGNLVEVEKGESYAERRKRILEEAQQREAEALAELSRRKVDSIRRRVELAQKEAAERARRRHVGMSVLAAGSIVFFSWVGFARVWKNSRRASED